MDQDRTGQRRSLRFPEAVLKHFRFLETIGYKAQSESDTKVSYDRGDLRITIFHGRGSYQLNVHFERVSDPETMVAFHEIWNVDHPVEPDRPESLETASAVDNAVRTLASKIEGMPEVLDGNIQFDKIHEYRKAITDFYAGKTDEKPLM